MVFNLRSLHSNFDHEHDQIILVSDYIPSMNNLVNRLFRVPTLLKDENSAQVSRSTSMVAPWGRGGGCRY